SNSSETTNPKSPNSPPSRESPESNSPPVPNLTPLVPPLSHNLHPMSLPQHARNHLCPSTPDNPF
ncbi:hypothetical protein A2U01_0064436, partial [Trifolium medium]|nr:hypothetical protein [Trifolium medium]